MAPIPCDLCGEEQAVMIQTAMATGDTLGVGEACLMTFYLATLAELTGGIPREVAAAYDDVLAVVIKNMAPSMIDLAVTSQRRPRGKRASPTLPTADSVPVDGVTASQTDSTATPSGPTVAESA